MDLFGNITNNIMHRLFTAQYDASVYLQQPDQNTGRDELLEVGKLYYGTSKDIARAFIKFDVTDISSSISKISGSWQVFLNLKASNSEEIPLEYTIHANAVSQSWTMGTGTKFDNITSDGISWKYRNGVNTWQDNVIAGTAYYTPGTTGSANAEGGTWYTASQASQSYIYEPDDVRMDVSRIVSLWISGSLPNNGFVVHHSLQNENNELDYGVLKFFSKETHTIYEPKLELVYDDSSFITGSLTKIPEEKFKVVYSNLKARYPKDGKVKIRVKGRELYPLRTFSGTFDYDNNSYLPTSSYYQLEDYVTQETIFPYGEYTKISCDSSGSYLILDLNTLPENRTYVLKTKIVQSGIEYIIDDKSTFEIV
jgi:hypothetical protein